MLLSTHALAGIVISQHINNVPAVFGLSIIAHYLMDMIPHGDEGLSQWIKRRPFRGFFITILTEIALLYVFIFTLHFKGTWPRPEIALAGLIGGILPDIIWSSYDLYRNFILKHFPRSKKIIQDVFRLESFFEHHNRLHKWFHEAIERKISFPAGVFIQAAIVFGLLLLSVKTP
ncbi:MAG: hypothetical protein COT26_01450 [Candidatus Kerfeldbacteria bacterium CG08_land_8_20_14_0_20_43_14]|uniref:DUF3307 domain-containing protein n=1 Tax=Candidatus Kerfeldbacteria bacterium CG08_land_8_20_14_0_20_43_14 TaxID=2014246 RepID=A0A2H0YQN4_9BACT|nr:MAG: hypothetical protein COT26_01450 [Candidatus Kerfeldbacteria bacterium CG08_land_8_20_14_0_20_43_14]